MRIDDAADPSRACASGERPAMYSMKKRYAFSLLSNLALCLPRVVNSFVIPRALGPSSFGDYQFLVGNFTALKNFLDCGSSTAFFNYNAKNPISRSLNKQFFVWSVLQLVMILALVASSSWFGLHDRLWPGQKESHLYYAALSVWIFLMAQVVIQFGDSRGETILFQKMNLFANAVYLAVLLAFRQAGAINPETAFLLYAVAPAVAIILFVMRWSGVCFGHPPGLMDGLRSNVRYFLDFCSPLFVLSVVGFLGELADKWMLQKFCGSEAQGYYSLSYNWSAISLIFFNPMLNIFFREVSVVSKEGRDTGAFFGRHLKLMFSVTAVLSFFLAINAREIILVLAGREYEAATTTFMIIIFFPLIQVCGQMATNVYLALGMVSLYRDISIFFTLIYTALTYIVIAPRSFLIPGLGLGLDAFSLKFFLSNLFGTEFLVFIISRMTGAAYGRLAVQRCSLIVLLFALNFLLIKPLEAALGVIGPVQLIIFRSSIFFASVSLLFEHFHAAIGLDRSPSEYLKNFIKGEKRP